MQPSKNIAWKQVTFKTMQSGLKHLAKKKKKIENGQ